MYLLNNHIHTFMYTSFILRFVNIYAQYRVLHNILSCDVVCTNVYHTIENTYSYSDVYMYIFFAFACVMQKLLCSTQTSTASTVVLKRDSCSSSISMTSAHVASLIMPWHQHNKKKEGNKVVQECVTVCCILTIKKQHPTTGFSVGNRLPR